MNGCPFCLGTTFHSECAERFSGSTQVPSLTIRSGDVESVIAKQAEKIGGVQPKFTVDLAGDAVTFVPEEGGRYIVKPQGTRKHLPQNEHLAMCLARHVGIEVAEVALVRLADGAYAFVTKRFDRDEHDPHVRYHQLDFCQLLSLTHDQKYEQSADRCVDVIRRHSADSTRDVRKLFRLLVFSYWIGNGDLHLKNLSLLYRDGLRLAPAYDLACSYVFGDERFALFVRHRQKDIPRREWLLFAETHGLSAHDASAIIDKMIDQFDECTAMVRRSGLPLEHQPSFLRCMTKRRRALRGHSAR